MAEVRLLLNKPSLYSMSQHRHPGVLLNEGRWVCKTNCMLVFDRFMAADRITSNCHSCDCCSSTTLAPSALSFLAVVMGGATLLRYACVPHSRGVLVMDRVLFRGCHLCYVMFYKPFPGSFWNATRRSFWLFRGFLFGAIDLPVQCCCPNLWFLPISSFFLCQIHIMMNLMLMWRYADLKQYFPCITLRNILIITIICAS